MVKGGKVVNADGVLDGDIFIEDGTIKYGINFDLVYCQSKLNSRFCLDGLERLEEILSFLEVLVRLMQEAIIFCPVRE